MGLFGNNKTKGITEYELRHDRLQAHLDSVFPSNSYSAKQKRAALHTALGLGMDRDVNMSSSQKYSVIQPKEFEAVVHGLEAGGVITSTEAAKLRKIAEKPLSD